jgi:hypothetical protein
MSESVSFKARVLPATVEADWTYPWITAYGGNDHWMSWCLQGHIDVLTEDVEKHDLCDLW